MKCRSPASVPPTPSAGGSVFLRQSSMYAVQFESACARAIVLTVSQSSNIHAIVAVQTSTLATLLGQMLGPTKSGYFYKR
jgi:hypothetical protein